MRGNSIFVFGKFIYHRGFFKVEIWMEISARVNDNAIKLITHTLFFNISKSFSTSTTVFLQPSFRSGTP